MVKQIKTHSISKVKQTEIHSINTDGKERPKDDLADV